MKVYIAGKITGDQGYQAKFRRAAAGLRMCGNIVLNPAELPEGMTAADYIRICMAMIDAADRVIFLPDAEDSPGAFLEIQYCRYAKKRVRRFSEAVEEEQAWRD
jgi:hypothetical protein